MFHHPLDDGSQEHVGCRVVLASSPLGPTFESWRGTPFGFEAWCARLRSTAHQLVSRAFFFGLSRSISLATRQTSSLKFRLAEI